MYAHMNLSLHKIYTQSSMSRHARHHRHHHGADYWAQYIVHRMPLHKSGYGPHICLFFFFFFFSLLEKPYFGI